MNVDPSRLRFLLAVARYGGVIAAADELSISPSAVSQQVAKLEKEVDRVLLRRTRSGSMLTAAGLTLAEAAEDVERALAVARARLEEQDSGVTGTVHIGGFQSFLTSILAPQLPGWRRRYRALRFETVEADDAELLRLLRSGDLDATIVELDAGESYVPPRGTVDVPLLDEPWKLVVPSGALLSASGIADLSRLRIPWLGVDPNAASADAIRRVRQALGGEKSTHHEYVSLHVALALVAAGEGMTLAPALALEAVPTHGVDLLDIPGLGMRRLALRHLTRSFTTSPNLTTAISLIREASAAFSYEPSGS